MDVGGVDVLPRSLHGFRGKIFSPCYAAIPTMEALVAEQEGPSKTSLISFSDIFGVSKSLTLLSQAVIDAARAWAEPMMLRRDTKAKTAALEKMRKQLDGFGLTVHGADIEIGARAILRLHAEQLQQQQSVEAVIAAAVDHANSLPQPGAAPKPVDRDWTIRLFDKAKRVTNEDMLKVWGRVLAQEASSPGSFGLRTLDVLSAMTREEAEAFRGLWRYVYRLSDGNAGVILPDFAFHGGDTSFFPHSDCRMLMSAGLLFMAEAFVGSPVVPCKDGIGEMKIAGATLYIAVQTQTQQQLRPDGTAFTLKGGNYSLTTAGRELLALIEPQKDEKTVEWVVRQIELEGFKVTRNKP